MGFVLWASLTLLALAAGLQLALKVGPRLSLGEQLVAAIVTASAFVVGTIELLGYASVLYPAPVGALVAAESLLTLALARPPPGTWRDFGRRMRSAARTSITPASLVVIVPASLLLLYMAADVWLLPSSTWDALWYHNTISAYAFQDHSLRWHEASPTVPFINAFPNAIELLGLWNVLFAPDDRLIDAVQWPMALMGVMALAALLRRIGASPSLSWGLGLCWLLFPAVFLNIPSGYNDVAIGSLRLAVILFLARTDSSGAHRLFGTLALGLYVGSKDYGALHAALLAPVVAAILWVQWRRRILTALRATVEVAGMAAGVLLLGGASYIRDLIRFRNPVWPARVKVFGHFLNGTWPLSRFNTPPWRGPDDWHALWKSFVFFMDPHARAVPYAVDVRAAGFGPLWVFVLLPVVVLALGVAGVRIIRGQRTPGALAILVLMAIGLATPATWWPRHTLGFPAAGLASAGLCATWWLREWRGQLLMAVIALFALIQGWGALPGFHAPLSLLARAARKSPLDRDTLHVEPWQFTRLNERERILQPGDAAVYDASVYFVYTLWRSDWKNRVLYRPPGRDLEGWVKSIEGEGARWAVIRQRSPAIGALHKAGWTLLGPCPVEHCVVWVHPRSGVFVPAWPNHLPREKSSVLTQDRLPPNNPPRQRGPADGRPRTAKSP